MDRPLYAVMGAARFPKMGRLPAFGMSMLVAALFLGLHGVLVLSGLVPALEEGQLVNLFDPDSYARALRLERFWAAGSLGSAVEPLLNAPQGMVLHWTRVVDVLGLAVAALVSPFAGAHSPVFLAGMVMGPLLHLAAIPLFLWGCRPFLSPLARIAACLLFLLQPAATFNFAVGTLDHHGLMALLAAALSVFMARALSDRRQMWAAGAGAVAGFAVWVSPEGIILQVPVLAAFALVWLQGGQGAIRGALAFTVVNLAVVALAVTIEGQWAAVDLYRVSQPHAALAVLTAAAAGVAVVLNRRVVASVAAMAGLLVLWVLFPGLFADPQTGLDPLVRATLIEAVGVEGPLAIGTNEGLRDAVLGLGPALPALLFSAWALKHRPAAERGRHLFALLAVGFVLAYVLLGKARGLQYMACFVTLPWAECLAALVARRQGVAALAALGHVLLTGGVALAAAPSPVLPACPTAALANFIGRAPAAAPVILADLFAGPEIAYRTGFGVIGAPYDQNVAGLTDTARLLGATSFGPVFWRLMAQRQVRAVVLCRHAPPDTPPGSLAARLLAGDPPPGFRPVALPPALAGAFVLYGVQP